MSSSFLSPRRNFSCVFEDYLVNNMHTVRSVIGKNAEGVFRRKEEWGSWQCQWMAVLGLSLPLPSHAVSQEWHPVLPEVWYSPCQDLGCTRAKKLRLQRWFCSVEYIKNCFYRSRVLWSYAQTRFSLILGMEDALNLKTAFHRVACQELPSGSWTFQEPNWWNGGLTTVEVLQ